MVFGKLRLINEYRYEHPYQAWCVQALALLLYTAVLCLLFDDGMVYLEPLPFESAEAAP